MGGCSHNGGARPGDALKGCSVLVVEDEYMLAEDLCSELRKAGVTVVGPVGGLNDAIELVSSTNTLDGAILDINVRGEMVFPLADLLSRRGTPFIFSTGYASDDIPARYEHIRRCEKPLSISKVARTLGSQLGQTH